MNDSCTNCGISCVCHYSLAFDGGATFPDVRLCPACVKSFRAEGWIDVAERSSRMSATPD